MSAPESSMTVGEQYRLNGYAQQALLIAGVDYVGETVDKSGVIVRQAPSDTAAELIDQISLASPIGYKLLLAAGLKV
jgi:hypothetical protein